MGREGEKGREPCVRGGVSLPAGKVGASCGGRRFRGSARRGNPLLATKRNIQSFHWEPRRRGPTTKKMRADAIKKRGEGRAASRSADACSGEGDCLLEKKGMGLSDWEGRKKGGRGRSGDLRTSFLKRCCFQEKRARL